MDERVTYHGVMDSPEPVDLTVDDDATCHVCEAPATTCLPTRGPHTRFGSAMMLCTPCAAIAREGDAARLAERFSEPLDDPALPTLMIAALDLPPRKG